MAKEVSIDSCSTDTNPLNLFFCVKKRELVKEVEAREDCFILGFDQTDDDASSDIKNLNQTLASDNVVSIVSEKGQMACRDYPHPRHNCWKYPFEKTSHENYCKLCYCYVCDAPAPAPAPAPCKKWIGISGHCHAFHNQAWNMERNIGKSGN